MHGSTKPNPQNPKNSGIIFFQPKIKILRSPFCFTFYLPNSLFLSHTTIKKKKSKKKKKYWMHALRACAGWSYRTFFFPIEKKKCVTGCFPDSATNQINIPLPRTCAPHARATYRVILLACHRPPPHALAAVSWWPLSPGVCGVSAFQFSLPLEKNECKRFIRWFHEDEGKKKGWSAISRVCVLSCSRRVACLSAEMG